MVSRVAHLPHSHFEMTAPTLSLSARRRKHRHHNLVPRTKEMAVIRAKKRERVTTTMMTTTTSSSSASSSSSRCSDDEEEYERAVAYLREFRSRRVAVALHSTSLDSILEAGDRFVDDVLAGEFSLVLSGVGGGGGPSKSSSSDDDDEDLVAARRSASLAGTASSAMRRATTSKCLLGLDEDDDVDAPSSPAASDGSRTMSDPTSLEGADYYFGYDCDAVEEDRGPATKRHRSLCGDR